ncbi:MAG: hypothetical protein AB8G16_00120 [Gammaproteobacteria bacterium]
MSVRAYDGTSETKKGAAANLVQALTGCPLEKVVAALVVLDSYASPNTKGRDARRWISQFCGFESDESRKSMAKIIEVIEDGKVIVTKSQPATLMKDMPRAA